VKDNIVLASKWLEIGKENRLFSDSGRLYSFCNLPLRDQRLCPL
jgi:hypothetical protein